MSIYHSRHTAYSQKKAGPLKKRRIALYGEGQYKGRHFKCWNCGFVGTDVRRDVVADTYQGGDGNTTYEYDDPITPFGMADSSVYITLDGPKAVSLMKLSADGSIAPIYVPHSTQITGGCPFCGCMNYR